MQLTVRLDDETAAELRRYAEQEGLSLNQAAVRLVREATGLAAGRRGRVIGHALDRFIGTMDDEEAERIDRAVEERFGHVDEDMWR